VGLAGTLADYVFVDRNGHTVAAKAIDYNGQAAGYTADPQEAINYIEAHDNDTLFDAIQLKAPRGTPMADRVRMQNLGMSLLAFGQGIPFFHAGVDLLRSKSLDRNSYNSGDWFNRLDFTKETNNWGVGLPPAADNQANWPIMQPLLADPALRPGRADIRDAFDHFREVLAIRRSSPLFRLRTAADVQQRLRFHNTGPSQLPGVIAFSVADEAGTLDEDYRRVAVVLNATGETQTLTVPELARRKLKLHPIQKESEDRTVRGAKFKSETGRFTVPARTAAVFVEDRKGGHGHDDDDDDDDDHHHGH
jgi:pullulanase-type alpha-1,6-glucosidase